MKDSLSQWHNANTYNFTNNILQSTILIHIIRQTSIFYRLCVWVCVCPYFRLGGQHVVPEDWGPAAGQLTDIRDDHDRQRHGLEQQHVQSFLFICCRSHFAYVLCLCMFCSHLQFYVQFRLIKLQLGLKAERVKLLCDDQRTLDRPRHQHNHYRPHNFTNGPTLSLLPRLFCSLPLSALSVAAWRMTSAQWRDGSDWQKSITKTYNTNHLIRKTHRWTN